ncbi:hypothetical protein [Massilia sp. Se16.2.3]|uniref:hypothetical protein n=1 Tax=Massilia sp. Se16.2.3 TaxID=2709303 RepID=UPI001E54EBEA|nr:hypothetical protein [Massilia sp. Se16.2.3]
MLKKFLFADLDDTLFQTLEKCAGRAELEPAAYYSDGSICSYTTPAQRAFFAFASEGTTVIPTTARSLDAFRRVDLGFSSYVILNFGGVILLPDGAIDREWQAQMHGQMTTALPGSAGAGRPRRRLGRGLRLPWPRAPGGRRGHAVFVVLKDPDKDHDTLARIEREVVQPWLDAHAGYCVHRNGNNLAILPRSLDKAHAVAHVTERLRREHGEIVTFGMGDSRSDARFMADCDYAIVPRGTQLSRLTLEAL